ncbi:TetR/AcrR family transcriptional regulator [Jatrophihabitans fulvus]
MTRTAATPRERIVAAAARLLDEHGPDAVTTRAVAGAAGLQAPAIYRLFGDKDGLLDAVAEHRLAQYVEHKSADGDIGDPVVDLRAAWARHVRFGLDNPAVFALMVDPSRSSPAARAGLEVLRTRIHRVAAAGRLRVPEERAVALVHAAGTGAVLTQLALPHESRDPGLADAMLGAVLRDVLVDADVPSADGVVAAAVTVRAAASGFEVLSEAERQLLGEWLDRVASA